VFYRSSESAQGAEENNTKGLLPNKNFLLREAGCALTPVQDDRACALEAQLLRLPRGQHLEASWHLRGLQAPADGIVAGGQAWAEGRTRREGRDGKRGAWDLVSGVSGFHRARCWRYSGPCPVRSKEGILVGGGSTFSHTRGAAPQEDSCRGSHCCVLRHVLPQQAQAHPGRVHVPGGKCPMPFSTNGAPVAQGPPSLSALGNGPAKKAPPLARPGYGCPAREVPCSELRLCLLAGAAVPHSLGYLLGLEVV